MIAICEEEEAQWKLNLEFLAFVVCVKCPPSCHSFVDSFVIHFADEERMKIMMIKINCLFLCVADSSSFVVVLE